MVAEACNQTWVGLFLSVSEVSVGGIHQTSSNFMDNLLLRVAVSKEEKKAHLLLLSDEGMLRLWEGKYLLSM